MSNVDRSNTRECKLLRAIVQGEVGRWRLTMLAYMHNDSMMRDMIRKSGGKFT